MSPSILTEGQAFAFCNAGFDIYRLQKSSSCSNHNPKIREALPMVQGIPTVASRVLLNEKIAIRR